VHVFVDLYRTDGTLRWLTHGGWLAGNLVAVGERVWGRRTPIRVTNPQVIYRGIRIRYEIDAAAAADAIIRMEKMVQEIRAKARRQSE
jgi:hypothetical protein